MRVIIIFALVLCLLPFESRANAIWYSAMHEMRIRDEWWWIIPLTILLEWPVVRHITRQNWLTAFYTTFFANILSGIAGVLLVVGGLLWDFSIYPAVSYIAKAHSPLLAKIIYYGFNLFMFSIISSLIEGAAIRFFMNSKFNKKEWLQFFLINAVTTFMVMLTLIWKPIPM